MSGLRITRKVVDAKVDNVNRLLGFNPDTDRYQVGMLMVQGAYGGYRVERITSEGRSTSPIGSHAFGPMRDCALILDGFRECLLIQQHDDAERRYAGEGQTVATVEPPITYADVTGLQPVHP